MRSLTSHVGNSHSITKKNQSIGIEVARVLIVRPNSRLGNLLLLTPLVQEVVATFPNCVIDLFVKGEVAPIIFRNYTNVDRIVRLPAKPFENVVKYLNNWLKIRKHQYDLVINVDNQSSSGKISSLFSKSGYKIFGENDAELQLTHSDYHHMAKFAVYNFRKFVGLLGFSRTTHDIPTLDIKLTAFEKERGLHALNDIVDKNRKTICIFTNATGNKCYDAKWWSAFYKKLLQQFPNYNIIEVLPMHNASQINFEAPSFYSLDIREIAAFISNTELFIGADSGMMHLASAAQTTVIGLFKVSNKDRYQPYGNGSTAINTNDGTIEDWLNIVQQKVEERKNSKDTDNAAG